MESSEEKHSDEPNNEIELESLDLANRVNSLISIQGEHDNAYVRLDPEHNAVGLIHQPQKSISTSAASVALDEKQKESIDSPILGPTTTVAATTNTRTISVDDYHKTDEKTNTVTDPNSAVQDIDHPHHIKSKFRKLFISSEFLGRILILILSLLCLALATAYCLGQSFESTLSIVKHCEKKRIEQIWQHSYNAGLMDNDSVEMNTTSQYGHTDEPCWSTKSRETDTEQLWYQNLYEAQQVEQLINVQSVLFGIIVICFIGVICYNIYTLCNDIMHVSRNELYKTSKMYTYFISQQLQQNSSAKPPQIDSWLKRRIRDAKIFWEKYLTHDTTGWIIRGVISEILEIVVQTQALFLYNGYNVFDRENRNDIYLAHKAHLIKLFVAILSFNCFGSGILWLSYSLLTKCCHGLLFKLLLFFVDQCSDLFYSIFPLFLILWNDYNANTGRIQVLLAELKTESQIAFISTFLPLLLLGIKSFNIVRSARNQLADRYYKHWKFMFDVRKQKNNQQLLYQAKINMYNVDCNINKKELYDPRGYFSASLSIMRSDKNWIYSNYNGEKISYMKQCILVCIALIYIIYGVWILLFVLDHLNDAQSYCSMIKESNYFVNDEFDIDRIVLNEDECSLLHSNPELYFWDKCLYKVYPFVTNDKSSIYHHRCQCRVLIMQWNTSNQSTANVYFGLNQSTIITAILEHFFMLEKFQTNSSEKDHTFTNIKSSMFIAKEMKAFEWKNSQIGIIEPGFSAWSKLEYLGFENSNMMYGMSDDFNGLESLKYVWFDGNQLQAFPESLCNSTKLPLRILFIHSELKIESIPHCVSNLDQLEELIIDNCIALEYVPLAIFNLPNLITLSLFHSKISFESLLSYNAPTITAKNDSNAVSIWFNDYFIINQNIEEFYLSLNPICEDSRMQSLLSKDMYHLFNESCFYPCIIRREIGENFCPPRLLQNGRCDYMCNNGNCRSDLGDCVQLCFSPSLTNCSYTKYTNDDCDQECDNKYCTEYANDQFEIPEFNYESISGSDLYHCNIVKEKQYSDKEKQYKNDSCWESNSTIFTNEFKKKIGLVTKCNPEWIANGVCDDLCRTDECQQDGGDCSGDSCTDNYCEYIYDGWLYFVAPFVYNVNISYFCNTIRPSAVVLFGTDPLARYSCEDDAHLYDWNDDGYVNFREFVHLAYWFGGGWQQTAKQLNCSSCIGMEYYNVDNNDVSDPNTTLQYLVKSQGNKPRCNTEYY